MNQYKTFASIYDIVMQDIDYSAWAKYIQQIWKKYNHKPKLILDLGCGTATLTTILSKQGYELIGIDSSEEMLSIAAQKASENNLDILFLNQKMQSFELYGTVDCIISVFDSINYITEKDELINTFKLVKTYLNDDGLFIFDINTPYKYKSILNDNTFAEMFEGEESKIPECAYIWENLYDPLQKINEYALTLFIQSSDGKFEKTTEYHYQKAYGIQEIKSLLASAQLEVLDIFSAYGFEKPKRNSDRIFFICKG